MSTQQVTTEIAGTPVSGEVVAREPTADFGSGPRDVVVLDVDGVRYRVDETEL